MFTVSGGECGSNPHEALCYGVTHCLEDGTGSRRPFVQASSGQRLGDAGVSPCQGIVMFDTR